MPFGHADFDLNSDGTTDKTITALDVDRAAVALTANGSGALSVTVRVYDPAGAQVYSATRKLFARTAEALAQTLTNEYAGAIARLKAGDVDGAVRRFTDSQQVAYRNIFTTLGSRLPAAVDGLGVLGSPLLDDDLVIFSLLRTRASGASAFEVQFLRGKDGLWRIGGM